MPTAPDLETWENITDSRYVLRKFNARGDLADELIAGRKTFHLTTQERHINSEMVAASEQDPFKNGMFSPVRLLDGTEDADEIASNPNLISESEMAELVNGKVDPLRKRIGEINNAVVLRRFLEVAEASDSRVTTLKAIKERIDEVDPSKVVEIDHPGL
jgi:hypothetical protein